MVKPTHIDLFTGIGGFTLAAEWAGFRPIVFCEKDEYCQKILKRHWPNVPIVPDIKDFDGRGWRGATLLTGGFPCQPFSVAGKRRGKDDDRYLWHEMFRVISEARPRWVVAENVTGIIGLALDDCLSDLESAGYSTETFIIPACAVGAPHRRDRVWIIAHNDSQRGKEYRPKHQLCQKKEAGTSGWLHRSEIESRMGGGIHGFSEGMDGYLNPWDGNWEADIPRVVRSVPNRVKRLTALGNAIVPQVAYQIMKAIATIEKIDEVGIDQRQ